MATAAGCATSAGGGPLAVEPSTFSSASTSASSTEGADAMAADDTGSNVITIMPGTSDAAVSGCSDAATSFVYVISNANDLYQFAPDQKTFTKIGTIACTTAAQPNSMAIDRTATAWVDYLNGTIYRVSTTDASCESTGDTLPLAWTQDGMGYSTTGPGATTETLFLTGVGSSVAAGLGTLDLPTGAVTPIAHYPAPLAGQSAELTGTGDGRLFGFFATSPVELAQIEPSTAAIDSMTPLPGLALDSASSYAFSFWGGRFYFYTYPNTGSTSTNVAQYDPTSGTLDTAYMTDIGFVIVGAGVSTCAPLVPPIPR